MHILAQCQFLRHKADLDKRPHTVLQQSIVDLIDIREVVDRISLPVFVVNANFVMQDVMKADITELSHFLHFAEIAAIPLAQGKNRASRPECLFPKMGKRVCRRMDINIDFFRRALRLAQGGKKCQPQQNLQQNVEDDRR